MHNQLSATFATRRKVLPSTKAVWSRSITLHWLRSRKTRQCSSLFRRGCRDKVKKRNLFDEQTGPRDYYAYVESEVETMMSWILLNILLRAGTSVGALLGGDPGKASSACNKSNVRNDILVDEPRGREPTANQLVPYKLGFLFQRERKTCRL